MPFDANDELQKLEEKALPLFGLAYGRIERAEAAGKLQSKLQSEVNSLSPQEMKAVGLAAEHDHNERSVALPFQIEPVIEMKNDNVEVTGFIFKASYWQQEPVKIMHEK